jgi:hypothetical protein
VRVPPWFTVAQALRVAELKGAHRLFLEGRASGVVSRIVLEHAPANDMVLRWAYRWIPSIDADAPVSEARRLLAITATLGSAS